MPLATGARTTTPHEAPAATTGRDHRQAFHFLLIGMALLVLVAWLFTYGAVKVLSGGRGYLHGEGRWSKAQQEAVFFLDRYAGRGDPADLAQARAALAVPLGDRQARLALREVPVDLEQARAGFLQGENHPDDIPTMIWLFENFEQAPYFRDAIRIWAEADRDILRLGNVADRLERQWRQDDRTPAGTMAIRADLERTDQRLRDYETDFSRTLNAGLRLLEIAIVGMGAVLMLVFFGLALLLFRRATRRIRASEQKFWAGFAHAPIGFALLSREGDFTEVNDTLCRQIGGDRARLRGRNIRRILHPDDQADLATILTETTEGERRLERRCRHADGRTVWSELHLCPLPPGGDSAEAFVVLIKDISEEKQDRERLTYEASHDALTGLFNRAHFENELKAVLAQGNGDSAHVLGFMDLDRFKEINDRCGHAAGDEVLKALATLMRDKLRASDILARLGGDEFGFLLRHCPPEQGEAIAETIRTVVSGYRFERDGRTFPVSASIGLVALDPGMQHAEAALQCADDACYRAKDRGRDRVEVHTPMADR